MKKTLPALLATVVLVGGAVGVPTSASAEEYPGTVPTVCNADGAARMVAGHRPTSRVRIKTAGSGKPVGTIRVRYVHKKTDTVRSTTVKYRGERVTFRGPKLWKVGAWRLRFTFVPKSGSVWKSSRDSYTLRVVKKR